MALSYEDGEILGKNKTEQNTDVLIDILVQLQIDEFNFKLSTEQNRDVLIRQNMVACQKNILFYILRNEKEQIDQHFDIHIAIERCM